MPLQASDLTYTHPRSTQPVLDRVAVRLKDDPAIYRANRIEGPIVAQWQDQNRFCSKGEEAIGPAGPAAAGRGDCVHQVCVNHLKHKAR